METILDIEKLADGFDSSAEKPIEKIAAEKKTKKLDPKAKTRNRGKCIFPAESSKVNDDADHYPIGNIDQARSALRYAGKQKSAPWYNGTVEQMQKAVERAVHKAYPAIGKEDKKKSKKSSIELLIEKYAQVAPSDAAPSPEDTANSVWAPTEQTEADAAKFMEGTKPVYEKPTAIPTYIQQSLNDLLGTKLDRDGELGPQTRAALDKFKAQYNVPNGASDEDVYNLIIDTAAENTHQNLHKKQPAVANKSSAELLMEKYA